ncbi:LysR family transcriptional regulator [Thalassotalea piscium]
MELRQLRYFKTVVKTGRFSDAASILGRTQQAISKSISNLEDFIGMPILERGGTIVRPTSVGKLLLQHVDTIDRQLESFSEQLILIKHASEGRIKIGVGPVAAKTLLPMVAVALRKDHPKIVLEVFSGIMKDMAAEVITGEIDLIIGVDTEGIDNPGMEKEILGYERFCIVVGQNHPICSTNSDDITDLLNSPWVIGRNLGELTPEISQTFLMNGISIPEDVTYTTSVEFAVGILKAIDAVAILPKVLINEYILSGQLKIIAEHKYSWLRPVTLLYSKTHVKPTALISVISSLHQISQLPESSLLQL